MWPQPPVIFDSHGNIYVTVQQGGQNLPLGGVVELSPITGVWKESIIHAFQGYWDGELPYGGLVSDNAGHLYGATQNGGYENGGVVFRVGIDSPNPFIVLAPFNDGPNAPPTLGANGVVYGSTYGGGPDGAGTIFKLTPNTGGASWTQTVLYTFTGPDGDKPSSIVFDPAGNIYGTTVYGGAYGFGTVFQLSPQADGSWHESLLHSFAGPPNDGSYPNGTVTLDAAGNIYGATLWGGASQWGTAYKLTPLGGGNWSEAVLHSFTMGNDGGDPGTVVLDSAANIYGTSSWGQYGCGLVYKITP
jgi:uncharacterized repeat protein (TIGR03803 family)